MKIYLVFLICSLLSEAINPTVAGASKPKQQCRAYSKDSNVGANVVSSCPENYAKHPLVKSKCSSANDFSDPLMANLITDVSTSVTFQNIYCAECNDVTPESMEFWNIGLYCESLLSLEANDSFVRENIEYKNDINKWGVMVEGQFHQCDLSFKKPENLNVKQCRTKRSNNCPPNWHRNAVKQACSSCMNAVNDDPFKNYHCLICNSEPDTSSICKNGKMSTRSGKRTQLSFPLLLDINLCHGNEVGAIKSKKCCANGETWDPFFGKCREIVCAIPDHQLVDEQCVKSESITKKPFL